MPKPEEPVNQSDRGPDAVGAWLRRDLARQYAPVLEEALPADWLALLEPHKP